MIDYNSVIERFYPEAGRLRDILVVHSRAVADMALEIYDAHPAIFTGGAGQREFVEAAAMLHDIGIVMCDAPGIECHGTQPYICHGTIGAQMLRSIADPSVYGMDGEQQEQLARVCERHTGTGLTRQQIERQQLPLPHRDFTPETIEEQLICYADKFFSKTHPDVRKTYDHAQRSLMKFGEECVGKFNAWHEQFGGNRGVSPLG